MSRFDYQSLLLRHLFQVSLYESVLEPVLADLPGLAVGDQLIRIEGNFEVQVVVDHHLECLARQTVAFVLVDGLAVEVALGTIAVCIDTSVFLEFIHELGSKFLMKLLGHIAESVLEGDPGLSFCQTEASVRSSADPFLEFRIVRILVSQFDGHGVADRLVVQHIISSLLCTAC